MTPSLSQPQRRVRLQLPETASYLQLHEKQKFLCKKLAHDKDVQHQQKVNSKQSKQKSPHCCSEERAAQPVSNVCSKEEQCMRNRQSRQEGGGGGGGSCPGCLLQLFHNALFQHQNGGERQEEAGSLAERPTPFFNKEVCHHLLMILTSCLRKSYFAA